MENKFWKTVRGKAIIKLIIWLIFIAGVFALVTFMGPKETNNNSKPSTETLEQEKTEKEEDILDLANKNYDFSYKIIVNNKEYLISGNVDATGEHGYKETQEGTIKYEKIDNHVYQVNLEEKTEITNFYEGLNAEFLDYAVLSTILSEYHCRSEVCNFSYNNYLIEINQLTNNSFKINISNDLENYELTYQNIIARD